jgi:hypothetical protein
MRIEKVILFQAFIKALNQTRSTGLTGFYRCNGFVSKSSQSDGSRWYFIRTYSFETMFSKKDPENLGHPVEKT